MIKHASDHAVMRVVLRFSSGLNCALGAKSEVVDQDANSSSQDLCRHPRAIPSSLWTEGSI